MSGAFDVLVVGGGPAGSSVAGALASRGRSVVLFERGDYDRPRVGEALGGEIGPLLQQIGAADAMEGLLAAQVPFRAVRSAWGSAVLEERLSMLHPLGEGVHVDRAEFDERLAAWASSVGVSVRRRVGTCAVIRTVEGFRLSPARGEAAEGRFLVDASGRGAPAGRALGYGRWLACDRQVALVARMTASGPRDFGVDLLLEAAEDGWWYSIPQPDGALVVALVTDADLAPAGGRTSLPTRFLASLAKTKHTAARTEGLLTASPLRVVRADSGCLLPDRGIGWCAVGDAAMGLDPLAGNGVARAIRSAGSAASAIDLELAGTPSNGAGSPAERLAEYLDRRAEFYLREARWPDAPFWARRRPLAWKDEPLRLDPRTMLRTADVPPPLAIARVESLLPPRAIALALELLRDAAPAHVAMSRLRDFAPIGDRRLLVGLQLLEACGAVGRLG